MNFEEPFVAAVQSAVTPSEADVLVARGVILDAVDGATEPVVTTEFVDRWLEAIGSSRPAPHSKFTALPAKEEGRRLAGPDPMDPHMAEYRGTHAVRWAVSQLVAEGVLTRGAGNNYAMQPERINVDYRLIAFEGVGGV